jgi:hypothetical protein
MTGLPPAVHVADPLSLRAKLAEDDPYLQVDGARSSFVVSATLAETPPVVLVPRARVDAIELLKQTASGGFESALVSDGTLSYPDRGGASSIALSTGDFIALSDLREATITQLSIRSNRPAIDLRLDAIAGRVDRSSGNMKQDLRRTAFDALRQDAPWGLLVAVLIWLAFIAIGMHRNYRGPQPAP